MITSAERETVHLNVQKGTYAYIHNSGTDAVLIALNTSQRAQTINVPISSLQTPAKDLLNNNPVQVSEGSVKVSLPRQSGAFIAKG